MQPKLLRVGDPSASTTWYRRARWPIMIGLVAGAIWLAAWSIAHWARVGDVMHLGAATAGFSLGAVAAVAVVVWWVRRWRSQRGTLRASRREHPDELSLGVRIPVLDPWPTGPQPWDEGSRLAAGAVVARFGGAGITFLTGEESASALDALPWASIGAITPVEYVEQRVAYQGIALARTGPEPRVLVMQIIEPGRFFVRYPNLSELSRIAQRMQAMRPAR